jgi:hypothetical protein
MRVAFAAAVLACCACEVKLNRGPHLPNAPEDSDRAHGGIEIAAKDPPKSVLPLPPPPVQYAEEKYAGAGMADPSQYLMKDPVPPEVRRLGDDAVAAYLDLLAQAEPVKLQNAKNATDLASAGANLANWRYDVLRRTDGAFTIVTDGASTIVI